MKAKPRWLEGPRIPRISRLGAYSNHICYGSKVEMKADESEFLQSLNGTWRPAWGRCPGDRPADFSKEGYDIGKWDPTQISGHMEMQGYGKIHYIDIMYPWEGRVQLRPPHVD